MGLLDAFVSQATTITYEVIPPALYGAHAAYWGWTGDETPIRGLTWQFCTGTEVRPHRYSKTASEVLAASDSLELDTAESRDDAIAQGRPFTLGCSATVVVEHMSVLLDALESLTGVRADAGDQEQSMRLQLGRAAGQIRSRFVDHELSVALSMDQAPSKADVLGAFPATHGLSFQRRDDGYVYYRRRMLKQAYHELISWCRNEGR